AGLIGWAVGAVDLENAALFIPGGLYGAAKRAFGPPTARAAAAVILADSLLFSALSASAAGHALIAVGSLVKPAAAAQREDNSLAGNTGAPSAGPRRPCGVPGRHRVAAAPPGTAASRHPGPAHGDAGGCRTDRAGHGARDRIAAAPRRHADDCIPEPGQRHVADRHPLRDRWLSVR